MFKQNAILDRVISIATQAGKETLKIYKDKKQREIIIKKDQSPLTEADMISHHIICEELSRLPLNIPILSEESATIEYSERKSWHTYWLIDPLDGTKEFVNHMGQFSINIALIENHLPILGVVYAPVEDVCYYAANKVGSYKKTKNEGEITIPSFKHTENEAIVVISNYEQSSELNLLLKAIGPHSLIRMGSSLKICLVAEGKADIYPRLFPTSEWDTAAAHCILLEAAGDIYSLNDKTSLRYNTKSSLLNPSFIAINNSNKQWLNIL